MRLCDLFQKYLAEAGHGLLRQPDTKREPGGADPAAVLERAANIEHDRELRGEEVTQLALGPVLDDASQLVRRASSSPKDLGGGEKRG